MSPAANAAFPSEDPLDFSPDEVQHVWLPSRRSLCDLASQRYETRDDAAAINDRARALPVCAACEVVVEMLSRRLATLHRNGKGSWPRDPDDVIGLLGTTPWTWVSADLR